nr:MAG TPA: hypothetical protein [Caudoviricetes sp.]
MLLSRQHNLRQDIRVEHHRLFLELLVVNL